MNYLQSSFSVYMNGEADKNKCFKCKKDSDYLYKIKGVQYCKSCYDNLQRNWKQKVKEYINNSLYELFLK